MWRLTTINANAHLQVYGQLTCMSLDGGRKLEYPKETNTNGENEQTLHRKVLPLLGEPRIDRLKGLDSIPGTSRCKATMLTTKPPCCQVMVL